MPRLFRGSRRIAAIVLLLALGTGGAYAYTNSISVNGGNPVDAGYGSEQVSGVNVTNVTYTLNGSNPQNIDQVQFSMAPTVAGAVLSGATIKAGFGSTWYACVNNSGTSATCNTTAGTQLTVAAAQAGGLEVVAAQ